MSAMILYAIFQGRGADRESSCSEWGRSLHLTAFCGSTTATELLLHGGAHIHAVSNAGEIALLAVYRRSTTFVAEAEQELVG